MVGLEQSHPDTLLKTAVLIHGMQDGASYAGHQKHRVQIHVHFLLIIVVVAPEMPRPPILQLPNYVPRRSSVLHNCLPKLSPGALPTVSPFQFLL